MPIVADQSVFSKNESLPGNGVAFLAAAFIALAFLCAAPETALAHAIMVKSSPEKDSTITQSPGQVDVWFNEKVRSAHKSLAVINSTDQRVDNKDIQQETLDPTHIYTSLPHLPPDIYTVRYRVISADTHVVSG